MEWEYSAAGVYGVGHAVYADVPWAICSPPFFVTWANKGAKTGDLVALAVPTHLSCVSLRMMKMRVALDFRSISRTSCVRRLIDVEDVFPARMRRIYKLPVFHPLGRRSSNRAGGGRRGARHCP